MHELLEVAKVAFACLGLALLLITRLAIAHIMDECIVCWPLPLTLVNVPMQALRNQCSALAAQVLEAVAARTHVEEHLLLLHAWIKDNLRNQKLHVSSSRKDNGKGSASTSSSSSHPSSPALSPPLSLEALRGVCLDAARRDTAASRRATAQAEARADEMRCEVDRLRRRDGRADADAARLRERLASLLRARERRAEEDAITIRHLSDRVTAAEDSAAAARSKLAAVARCAAEGSGTRSELEAALRAARADVASLRNQRDAARADVVEARSCVTLLE
ncbi:unnamed protein product, partial [Phaeothamnion confervicola]